MKYTFGIDVGGTNIKLGLFSVMPFVLLEKREIITPRLDHTISIFKTILEHINELLCKYLIDDNNVIGVGLAVPCPVKDGFISVCPNLQWSNLNVIESMKQWLPPHYRVVVSNDANIAAYGENYTLDRPFKNAIFYTLGTGVGGGIIANGQIVEGRTGSGGEIGHMPIFETDETCGCGKKGCLEQVCGTKGILNYARFLSKNINSTIDFSNLSVKAVFDAAKNNDEIGLKALDRVAYYLAQSASILAVSLDPDIVIIGGGIAKVGQILIDRITYYYQKNARFGTHDVPFVLAKTGNDAGIIGAAKYMFNHTT